MVLGANVVVQGGAGVIGGSRYFGRRIDFVNDGAIRSNRAGSSLRIESVSGGAFTNNGSLNCSAGARLELAADSLTNAGSIFSRGDVVFEGSWSNFGTITLGAGTATLAGAFNASGVGSFSNLGATVELVGVFDLEGAGFAINGSTGNWRLLGGTVRNGTLLQTGGAQLEISTNPANRLEALRIQGDLSLSEDGAVARVAGDLSVTGTVRMRGQNVGLAFEGPNQTIQQGTILFESVSGNGHLESASAGTRLTLAPGVVVRGGRGEIGGALYFGERMEIVNRGSIIADRAGFEITVDGRAGGLLENFGSLEVTPGASLNLVSDSTTNSGSITSDGTLLIGVSGNDVWNNAGTVTLGSGVARFGGVFGVGALGTFVNSGSVGVEIVGTFDLGGGTFTLDAGTGSWRLSGGTVRNGTLVQSGGARLEVGVNALNRIDGVAIQGDLVLEQDDAIVRIANDLDISGSVRLVGRDVSLAFEGSQTIRNGTIAFESTVGMGYIEAADFGSTLTVGPGATIRGGRGVIGGSQYFGRPMNLVNAGTITADRSGSELVIDGLAGAVFTNDGMLDVGAGASMSVASSASTSNGSIVSSGTLALRGAWNNAGSVTLNAGSARLGGTFTNQSIGTLMNLGASVDISGIFDLGGNTFTLDAATGSWRLFGGTIRAGTIGQIGGSVLQVGVDANNTLDGVTVVGDLLLTTNGAVTRIANDLDVTGTVRMSGQNVSLGFLGSQTIRRGVIDFASANGNGFLEAVVRSTVTVAPGAVIRGGRGVIGGSWYFGRPLDLVNQGSIANTRPGLALTIDGRGGSHSNSGVIDLAAPSRISGGFTNSGTLRIAGAGGVGSLQISGGYTQTATGALEIDLAGSTPGSGHDALTVFGATVLAGTLGVNAVVPFSPTTGQQFSVINSSTPAGTFVGPVLGYSVNYGPTGVRLIAQ